jgi:mono/diheme cytochrome c family protein
MDTFGNAVLGLVFLALSFASTFLMYKLWGYPFDHNTLKSSAPRPLMLLHRAIGYVYLAIYIYLMSQMLPRLWSYQVELPARTVAHLMLGMSIGVIIVVKIAIVRFFKHLESQMAPVLGTALLVCTVLLIGLSVPIALREQYLSKRSAGGAAFSAENLERVRSLLPQAGFASNVPLDEISDKLALQIGRRVLLKKCVQCHDLRTILVRPKTPDKWRETVERMAERAELAEPIGEQEQWYVTAYLVAISPELQKSVLVKRQSDMEAERTKAAVQLVSATIKEEQTSVEELGKKFDLPATKALFEETCSLCHALSNVEKSPPANEEEATSLVDRMIDNGLNVTDDEFEQIVFYLTKTYAKQ